MKLRNKEKRILFFFLKELSVEFVQVSLAKTQSKEDDFRELTSNSCELQKRPARDFDLELPADGFVSDESFEVKSSVCDETGFNTREAGDHHSGINLNARGTVEEVPSLVRSNEAEIGGVWNESNADLREPREKGKEQTLSAGEHFQLPIFSCIVVTFICNSIIQKPVVAKFYMLHFDTLVIFYAKICHILIPSCFMRSEQITSPFG